MTQKLEDKEQLKSEVSHYTKYKEYYKKLSKKNHKEKQEDPEYREGNKRRVNSWRERNQNYRLLASARMHAKEKNVKFNLSIEDIVIPKKCPYLNIKITNITRQGRIRTNASIDRIDSTKGYVKGNIQILSFLANRMKQDATDGELLAFARGILRLHKKSKKNDMQKILSHKTISMTDLRKEAGNIIKISEPVAILNHNKPVAYIIPADLFEKMLDAIEDYIDVKEVPRLIKEAEAEGTIPWEDLRKELCL